MPDDDVPSYRLYTSEQAAERAGGGLVAATFDRWARSGKVEYTDPGRRILWTDAQIAAAIAYHATCGSDEEAKASPPPRDRHTSQVPRQRDNIAPLVSKPGRRYAASS
jgi:hypothetical protein